MERNFPKDVMSIIELSDYVGLSRSKIYQLIRNKKIPASKIGRQYKFSKEVIDSWLKESIITRKRDVQMRLPIEKKSRDNTPQKAVKSKKEEVKVNGSQKEEEGKEKSSQEES